MDANENTQAAPAEGMPQEGQAPAEGQAAPEQENAQPAEGEAQA